MLELTLGKIKPEEIQHWELSNFLQTAGNDNPSFLLSTWGFSLMYQPSVKRRFE